MKNRIRTIAALTLFIGLGTTQMKAQVNNGTPQFGIKGGVNFSNMYTEDVDDNNVLTSFNAGIYTLIPITDFAAFQPEVLFSRKGSELTYDNVIASGKAKFKLNYIEVPLLVKGNLTKNLSVHAGPYFAYLIDAQVTNETSDGAYNFEENFDNDDFNKFDAGLSAGIGLDFDTIGFGARYNYGLTTVGKERDSGTGTYTFPDGKNSNVSVYMTLKLN
ncbi:porin family protein [Flavobacterium faecale]|uniref:porin family protein n=1 Tax=Flavobacterium faecale TaxID=1355330 RepID=UPI003AAABCCD